MKCLVLCLVVFMFSDFKTANGDLSRCIRDATNEPMTSEAMVDASEEWQKLMSKKAGIEIFGLQRDVDTCCYNTICSFPYNGYGYFLTPKKSWQEARLFCQGQGGDLASRGMTSLSLRESIIDYIGAEDNVWVGATDSMQEGCFKWLHDPYNCAGGDTLHWKGGEPNNSDNEDCVEIEDDGTAHANDEDCEDKRRGVCEFVLPQCRDGCF